MKCLSQQVECEKSAAESSPDKPMMPVINDHYSAKSTELSLEHDTGSADNESKQTMETTTEKRTLKSSKSDSSLSVRDKTSSVSSDEGSDFESSKLTSVSNHELSTVGRNVPSHLKLDRPSVHPQVGYSVSPSRDGHVVPFTSYSSSEDEDEVEFFDADEFHDLESAPSR